MKRVVVHIVKFLRRELESGTLSPDAAEGVEVAVQCIENAYGITADDLNTPTPDLHDIVVASETHQIVTEEQREEAENLKLLGNVLMREEKYDEAISHYTRAIDIDGRNAVFYCNRAAAYIKLGNIASAISDCNEALRLDNTYSKAYSRLGYAQIAVGNLDAAKEAYKKALELEPDNENYQSSYQGLLEQMSGSGPLPAYPELMRILPSLDLTGLLQNQTFVSMAGQMLADPNMQNAVTQLLSGRTFPQHNVDDLIAAGQELADSLQLQQGSGRTANVGAAEAGRVHPDVPQQDAACQCIVPEEQRAAAVVVNEGERQEPNVAVEPVEPLVRPDVLPEEANEVGPPQPFPAPNPIQGEEDFHAIGDNEAIVPNPLQADNEPEEGQGDARIH